MAESILSALQRRVLLADGAMGTQLQAAGLKSGQCGEAWNLERPEAVEAIQRRYRDAGSDMVLTNTFGGTRIGLARHGLADQVAAVNRAAVAVARRAVGPGGWVVGDLGPFGGLLEPLGDAEPEEVEEAFAEQARALLDAGADLLLIETQTAIEEVECAVRGAVRALRETGLSERVPLAVSMAFDRTVNGPPRTMMGVDPTRAAERIVELGAGMLGCNCGTNLDLASYCRIVELLAAAAPGLPVIAQPNAGSPERVGDRIVYHEEPAAMAAGIGRLVDAGARIIGGCCGTTPEHIRLFGEELTRLGLRND